MNVTIKENKTREVTSFGPVHLRVTDLDKATLFWTKVAGLKIRSVSDDMVEYGAEDNTLVVVKKTAQKSYLKGYSGLYHFAIHVPNEAELASVINRLDKRRYPYSPVDHTISKAVYFQDLEGITVEYTLETPGRESQGDVRSSGPKPLDVASIMQSLEDDDIDKTIDKRSFIGHVHLYAKNVDESHKFYQNIGFSENKYKPHMVFADLGAGGDFGHRIAINSWHGTNRPLAPDDSAGLDHFELVYKDKAKLNQVLENLIQYEETPQGYWTKDPTGNKILLN